MDDWGEIEGERRGEVVKCRDVGGRRQGREDVGTWRCGE